MDECTKYNNLPEIQKYIKSKWKIEYLLVSEHFGTF